MNILMYGWEFPPDISGGLGMACYGIVNELSKKGMHIDLALPKSMENLIQGNVSLIGCDTIKTTITTTEIEKFNKLIDIHQIEALLHPYLTEEGYQELLISWSEQIRKNSHTISTNLTGKYGPNLMAEVFRYAAIASVLASRVPHDIIHAHDWLTGLAGVEAKRYSKKPFIFQVHALEYDRCGDNVNQSVFAIEKQVMEEADLVIAVSQYTKNVITSRYGINPDKVKVVHNGNYATENKEIPYKPTRKTKMVLFVGRITYQKGPWYFIEVARKILEKRKDIQFVIAGVGDQLKDMIDRVAYLQIGKNVHFTGFLTQKKVHQLYQLADVYVMPSVSEPFGLTCLEALAHNIPVVISKQSGAAEVLNHVLKADFWDVDEMITKIMAFLDYRVLRSESLSHSVKDLKSLTWENTADNLIDIYNELLAGKK